MLVISRRKGQRITIGEDVEIVVTALHKSSVKLGISAPRGYAVLRGEVRDSIEAANREAAATSLDDCGPGGKVVAPRAFIMRAKGLERHTSDDHQSQPRDGSSGGQARGPRVVDTQERPAASTSDPPPPRPVGEEVR